MTSLAGEFVTDLALPDLMVSCTEAIDGLGWPIESVDRDRIVAFALLGGERGPRIEVALKAAGGSQELQIIGIDDSDDDVELVWALDKARNAIQASIEDAAHSFRRGGDPHPHLDDPEPDADQSAPGDKASYVPQSDAIQSNEASGASPSKDDGAKVSFFGARGKAKELGAEVALLRDQLDRTGALSLLEVEEQRDRLAAEIRGQTKEFEKEKAEADAELARLREEIVVTEETAVLQEVGIYEYRHPLSDAVAYQAELKRLKDRIKTMARKDGGAILTTTNWTVNNSLTEGRRMVRDFSKLMLRAYNAEADNLVRGLKPYKLESAIDKLTRVATTIVKLGRTMDIRISDSYHSLRIRELELTADHLEKKAEEKEREREEKERLREERKAQEEMARERARLEKEQQHYQNALAALESQGDEEGAARFRGDLDRIDRAIKAVDYRAANAKAGYVYVISNIGSLGPDMVKIGMTRRLEPRDRVRELGDASVPFRYDTHALFFSDNAAGIEADLHRRLAEHRVNRVNRRREFFYATPAEVKEHLLQIDGVGGELLEYEEAPEAVEYHQSRNEAETPAQP